MKQTKYAWDFLPKRCKNQLQPYFSPFIYLFVTKLSIVQYHKFLFIKGKCHQSAICSKGKGKIVRIKMCCNWWLNKFGMISTIAGVIQYKVALQDQSLCKNIISHMLRFY